MSKDRFFKNEIYTEDIDKSNWQTVLVDNIENEEDRNLYLRRKKAVDMYFDNIKTSDIVKETGFHRSNIVRFAKRCLILDDNGLPLGYKALIPYKRIQSYKRVDEEKEICTGKFNQLLSKYPTLKEFIDKTYLGLRKKHELEKNITTSSLYKKFIKKCHELNIKEYEYPFNTKDAGRRSLYRYIENLENIKYKYYLNRLDDNYAQIAKSTGVGNQSNPVIIKPFQQVQFDGHKIDAMICIKFKTIEGDIIKRTMSRIWLLAIIDVATRTILGYHLCLNSEYSSYDVLKCIENAIKPKEKINLTIPNLKYPNNGGFHSIAIPETEWAVWDDFLYDNAKANLAKIVTNTLTNKVKCSINAGPVATPERRGIVERFFRTLESYGFHRLTNTTGSNIYDPKRKDAEKNAIEYEIEENEIEQITEILIANYNNTPHSGINGFPPLELMEQRIKERGLIPNIMDKYERDDLLSYQLKITRKISGNKDKGRRPYIYYEGVEYRSDILSQAWHLVGQKLTLLVNINDLRFIKAYLPDGSEFGVLTAKGKWALKIHTLKMRKEINQLKNDNKISFGTFDDPIDIYHKYLTNKSLENKPSRNKLATLNKLQTNNTFENSNKVKKYDKKNNPKNKNLINSDIEEIEKLKQSNKFKTLNF